MKEQFEKDYGRKIEEVLKFENILTERVEEEKSKQEEFQELLKVKVDIEREYELTKVVRNQILTENETSSRTKSQLLEIKII